MNRNDILEIAKKHSIRYDKPSPDFFEGALMGNGNLGAVVCSRPDSIVIRLGHNNIWDIRIAEEHKGKTGTFEEVWGRIKDTPGDVHNAEWYKQYTTKMRASYSNYLYPRPYPASSIYLFFDRKKNEVLGHETDISTGILTIKLLESTGKEFTVQVVLSMEKDIVSCKTFDEDGNPAVIFERIIIEPHNPDAGLPAYQVTDNGFVQILPYNGFEGEVRPEVDKGFSVCYRVNGEAVSKGLRSELRSTNEVTVQVTEGLFNDVKDKTEADDLPFDEIKNNTALVWEEYWKKSGIRINDEELERIWYVNTYFLRCVLNSKSRCPGLFGNWNYANIGTAWHGDYHMNYNTQQVFWGLMSANRQELHLPYLGMVEDFMPISTSWARDFYHLGGACFPHSAYPVPMTVIPYPLPDWGWEILETPWTVQSLWWHYTYTGDAELLRDRIYPLIRAAAVFLTGYMTREGANPNGDDKYHLFPTIVPELYGLSDGFKLNLDGAVDLALTKFVFKAVLEAVKVLNIETEEKELTDTIRKILAAYPDYPVGRAKWGDVYLSVQNEDPDRVVYNCPANLVQVFPGEDIDVQNTDPDQLKIAKNSWYHHYNEGGNDLVFYYMIGARLGVIDLEQFKRHVRYSTLPNESAGDRATLTGGRYPFNMDLDFMMRMGIWIENFSLHAVINECLMFGHTDVIELFPNWDKNKSAEFCSLRAKGAFLVDSACAEGSVSFVRITGENGGTVSLKNPWKNARDCEGRVYAESIITINLEKGESICLTECR